MFAFAASGSLGEQGRESACTGPAAAVDVGAALHVFADTRFPR